VRCAVLAFVALISIAALAHAEPPGASAPVTALDPALAPPPPSYRTETYRLQLVAADLAAIGLVTAGALTEIEGLAWAGGAGLFAFAPLVHVAHHGGGNAARSFGTRVGLSMAGAFGGAILGPLFLGCSDGPDCDEINTVTGIMGVGAGAAAGLVAAMAIDYVYFARTRVLVEPEARTWTPVVSATRGGVSLGVSGRF